MVLLLSGARGGVKFKTQISSGSSGMAMLLELTDSKDTEHTYGIAPEQGGGVEFKTQISSGRNQVLYLTPPSSLNLPRFVAHIEHSKQQVNVISVAFLMRRGPLGRNRCLIEKTRA